MCSESNYSDFGDNAGTGKKNSGKQFNCPVRAWYSNEENGIMASEQEDEGYHIDTETYYYEILKMDSDEPAEPGELEES